MYDSNYNGHADNSNLFLYCRIRPEGLSFDVERDLLEIAKFLVTV